MAGKDAGADAAVGLADQRRHQVLDAALRCMSGQGYASIRFRDIAREAEVSIGLIQHYFDSREDLLEELFQHACNTAIEEWRRAPSGRDEHEMLTSLLDKVTDRLKALSWREFVAAAGREEKLRSSLLAVYQEWRDVLAEVIENGVARGVFRRTVPMEEVLDVLIAYIDGALLELSVDAAITTPERVRRGWQTLTSSLLN